MGLGINNREYPESLQPGRAFAELHRKENSQPKRILLKEYLKHRKKFGLAILFFSARDRYLSTLPFPRDT